MGWGVGELGRRRKDILGNVAVVYKSEPFLWSSSNASTIRELYKFHLVLELSSTVTSCNDWAI